MIYAGIKLIPKRSPKIPPLKTVTVEVAIVPVEFRELSPLDLNSATASELEELPGIGPGLARRIVAYRETHGPFRSVEELLNVPGIGPATLERIRELVTVTLPKER